MEIVRDYHKNGQLHEEYCIINNKKKMIILMNIPI